MREAAGRNRHFATGQKIQPNLFVMLQDSERNAVAKLERLDENLLTPCTKMQQQGSKMSSKAQLKAVILGNGGAG
jgi:hypothetical protein